MEMKMAFNGFSKSLKNYFNTSKEIMKNSISRIYRAYELKKASYFHEMIALKV